MSDRITSKDGEYEGILQGTDGNFVVRRSADNWPIAALGVDVPDPITPEPEPEPTPLPLPLVKSHIEFAPLLVGSTRFLK